MRMFALSALCAFALAGDAAAQGVAFTTTSLVRQMRQEGITELAGEVVLTALNSGTIVEGSSIDVVFSAPITNNSLASPGNITLANNISCSNAAACPTSVSLVGTQTVRMFFGASRSFTFVDWLIISRVRVNASTAIGIDSITATMSGSSTNLALFPITFTDPFRQVGVLNPAIAVQFNHSSATANPVTLFQTCAFPNDAVDDFFVRLTEVFPGALTTQAQETVYAAALPPTNGLQIHITITNVPAGLTLAYTGTQLSTGALAVGAASPAASVDQLVSGTPISFIFPFITTDVSLVERTTFNFSLKPTAGTSIANVGVPINVQGAVQLTPITSVDSTIVRFVDNQIGPTTLATISNCPVPGTPISQITSD
jgi:hypothetical protein